MTYDDFVRNGMGPSQILAAIVSRQTNRLSLTTVWKEDPALYARARKHFGRWQRALEEAGVAKRPRSRPHTRQDVIHKLQSLHAQGESLSKLWKTDVRLCRIVVRQFGSLNAALTASGLPSHCKRSWSKRAIVEAIKRRHENGQRLSHVYKDDKALFSSAANHFGNWQSALGAAGISFKKRQRWTKDRVLVGLRLTYRGQPNFQLIDPALTAAAIRYFGNLFSAVEAAGLETPGGRWSARRITAQIQEYYIEGLRIGVLGCGDLLLGLAAKRHFGTWLEAVKASGLASRMPVPIQTRSWSPELVLKSIRLLAEMDEISTTWKKDKRLYAAAKKYFGSWRNAVIAAGFEPAHTRWSQDLIIHTLQVRNRQNPQPSSDLFREDSRLADAARRLFGSKQAALVAAGIAPIQPTQTKVISQR